MESLNILVVEDESLVALEITQTIQNFGYPNVDYATTAQMAKALLQENSFDLILMDINLGEERDGITLYQSLAIDTPIIYLTAYKDDATIQKAIETNPIGYLIKPYSDDELKALIFLATYKIKLMLSHQNKGQRLALGASYYFDTQEDKLFYHDVFIHLGKKELQLLKLLMRAKGNTVSYYSIENEIWGSQSVSSSTIRTLIYRLRAKLEYKLIKSEQSNGIFLKM